MYRLFFLIVMMPYTVLGQLTKRDAMLAKKRNQCYYSNMYSNKQRRAFSPFNKVATVRLISFAARLPSSNPSEEDLPAYTKNSLGHIDVNNSRVKESKVLSEAAIDSLTNIMYNVGYTPMKQKLRVWLDDQGYKCYNPRNAILFTNKKGEVTHYIEFCFECHGNRLSSADIKQTVYCEQKYDMLKAFFLKQGIKYGTILPKRDEE